MREKNFLLQDEGGIKNFLDVNITKKKAGRIELKQTGLINDILNNLGLNHPSNECDKKKVSTTAVLQEDEHEPDFSETWNYRFLIGKFSLH